MISWCQSKYWIAFQLCQSNYRSGKLILLLVLSFQLNAVGVSQIQLLFPSWPVAGHDHAIQGPFSSPITTKRQWHLHPPIRSFLDPPRKLDTEIPKLINTCWCLVRGDYNDTLGFVDIRSDLARNHRSDGFPHYHNTLIPPLHSDLDSNVAQSSGWCSQFFGCSTQHSLIQPV